MSAIAAILARNLWGIMLWIMRRPWMKRLQYGSIKLFPPSRREKARMNLIRQNRWARRYGQPLLRFAFLALLASMAITFTYYAAIYLVESGALDPLRRE